MTDQALSFDPQKFKNFSSVIGEMLRQLFYAPSDVAKCAPVFQLEDIEHALSDDEFITQILKQIFDGRQYKIVNIKYAEDATGERVYAYQIESFGINGQRICSLLFEQQYPHTQLYYLADSSSHLVEWVTYTQKED